MAKGVVGVDWNFDNSFTRLPELLFVRQDPLPVTSPILVMLNESLASELGLDVDQLKSVGAEIFSGNIIPSGAEPIAQAYAGHQFGYFTMLGDGRAIVLGELLGLDGRRFDLQLKGSGRTPFSRNGDGRAALGPMLREYVVSEAMYFLGIPTTRSLAVVSSGEQVYRESPLSGALLARIAASHIRVGTFEYAARLADKAVVKELADYAIARHYPEVFESEDSYRGFLASVIKRQASLVARWMGVGFIHGVMNTDNMAISGETIDYGPCAFLDEYHSGKVFSSIDRHGRYAFTNQAHIAQWNLARFAETLLSLLAPDLDQAIAIARAEVGSFADIFKQEWLLVMRRKLGLFNEEKEDESLIEELLSLMQQHGADYTNTFRKLGAEPGRLEHILENTQGNIPGSVVVDGGFHSWQARWQARLLRQAQSAAEVSALMKANNPFVIPRNHRLERALDAATDFGDFLPVQKLLGVLKRPYEDNLEHLDYCQPPTADERVQATFCGT
ncbi:MAG: YdiU family protein [bacterium]|nr:YdiU family protein [bacterium]